MKAKPKTEAKKKAIAKVVKKQAAKKAAAKTVKHEIVLHVDTTPVVPTETALAEPMRDGKKLTIPKTWLAENQLTFMLQRTPKEQVYRRKGRGGKDFDYVTGSYITKALNYVFGWNWDFEVVEHGKEGDHVWVLGRLTVRGTKPGENITKTQFGRSDVKVLTSGKGNVDYGNDLKAATTDALKKCASMLGFASDIYGKMEYRQESGQAPLPPTPVQAHPVEEKVIDYSQPQYKCMEAMQNGKPHGVSITKEQAELSLKMTGAELCKAHQTTRKG